MSTMSKWYLTITLLFIIFFGTFLVVYEQPKSQKPSLSKLKLELTAIDKTEAKSAQGFIDKGYADALREETNPNGRIDLFKEYLSSIVRIDEFNAQEEYEGRFSIENQGTDIVYFMGKMMINEIEKDTTIVFERHEDYVNASEDYLYLIDSSEGIDLTKEEQQEIKKAQERFEDASQAFIDVADQFYVN